MEAPIRERLTRRGSSSVQPLGQPQAAQTAPGDVFDFTALLHGTMVCRNEKGSPRLHEWSRCGHVRRGATVPDAWTPGRLDCYG